MKADILENELDPFTQRNIVNGTAAQGEELDASKPRAARRQNLHSGRSNPTSRATRRQKLEYDEDTDDLEERFVEATTDRRAGWRANKAKGNRRNRRYANRLLQGFDSDALDDDW
jgi:hypothetical protein